MPRDIFKSARRVAVSTFGVLALTLSASAADIGYFDNRSDPAALVTSYYNAVVRHEFARAWSYWHDRAADAEYEAFSADSQKVAKVELLVGNAVEEGAAGSIYYQLPVAVALSDDTGKTSVFGGCFVLRLAEPTIQEPPFAPLHIEEIEMAVFDGALDAALPEAC